MMQLISLGYGYDALEPIIDTKTMHTHYDKHYQGYATKYQTALDALHMSDIKDLSDTEDVLRDLENVDDSQRTAIRNNGGGFYNHSVFWSVMCPGGREMSADMKDLIIQHFGSVDDFCEHFAAAATGQFGSGWAWLIATDDGLAITSTANQDNPLMPYADQQGYPLLGLDVREHAYYLHYQNRRADYVSAWMETINRSAVEERYASVS